MVVAATAPPASLDFTSTSGAAIPQALMSNVYETLVTVNKEGEIVPHLAESFDVSEDGLTYTFKLRPNVRFSNGDEFTADTAVFSINNVKENWTNGLKKQMDVVSSARAIDPHTLEVTLSRPSNRWLWSMGTLTGAMMTPNGIDEIASNPIGTGPYTIARFVPNQSVSYEARQDYWSTPARANAAIRYYADAVSSVNALRTGDVDVVYGLQAPELAESLSDEYNVEVGTTNGEILLAMNNSRAPFDDQRVRLAAAHAIDRGAVSATAFESMAVDTGGAFVAPTDPWFTGKDYAHYDPERARQLLAESGNPHPSLTIKVPSLPYARNVAEIVYSQLTEVGFDVTLESIEFPAVWLSEVYKAADYEATIIAHVEARDLPNVFGSPETYLRYDDPTTRELLAQADSATTTEEQTRLTEQATARITEVMGSLTVGNIPSIVVTAPGVHGVEATQVTDSIDLAEITKES
ncbi:ABC transporter substrate-binding protein [Corynebacterium tapiri]